MESSVAATAPAADPEDQAAPDIARLMRYFTESRDLTQEARNEALIDIDYYDSKQWTASEREKLRERHQPDIVINRVKPAVNGILGVIERGKSEPRAYPRTPQDEDSADVATDALRFIADKNRFDQLKIHAFKDMLVPGTMAAQILVDGDMNVTIERIRWEELFYDPRSRAEDFSDARYLGLAKWMYADDVVALYPDKKAEIEGAVDGAGTGLTDLSFADRPTSGGSANVWTDRKLRRLLVVEIYYRDGGWKRACFITGNVLQSGDSPYLDDRGKPCCPIEASSAYIDRDNNRYGPVRDMRGPQDEINKRRSKALHYLNTRQIQEKTVGSGEGDADGARSEAARPDGVIPTGWEVIPQTDQVSGQLQLLQEAKSEIERLGPNPAVLGRETTDASGRALLARQQAGLVELAILFGLLEDWELRIYRQCWARAKQYWTAPQWIRVTDDEGAPQFVGLNQPQGAPVVDPQTGQPAIDPQTQQPAEGAPAYHPATDPMTGQPHPQAGESVFGYKNVVAEMDVDIIMDTTQDTANIQQEQYQSLVQLVGSNPAYAQSVPFEILLQLSTVPHKKSLLDQLKMASQQHAQTQAQAQQIATAGAAAKIDETQSQAELNRAKAVSEMHQGAAAHAQVMAGPPPPAPAPPPPPPPPGLANPQAGPPSNLPPQPPPIQGGPPGAPPAALNPLAGGF